MTRQRSPNFPQYSLPVAIEKIRTVYRTLHTSKADILKVAEALGYTSINGRSRRAISALRQYALLSGSGDSNSVTNVAVTILERQPGHPDRNDALTKAAFSPTLFQEIVDEFGMQMPENEDLRIFLVNKGFSRTAVNEIIDTYRDTLELVTNEGGEYDKQSEDKEDSPHQELVPMQSRQDRLSREQVLRSSMGSYRLERAAPVLPVTVEPEADQELRFKISADSDARISFRGEVTFEAIEKLIKLLELSKDTFPTKKQLDQGAPLAKQSEPTRADLTRTQGTGATERDTTQHSLLDEGLDDLTTE